MFCKMLMRILGQNFNKCIKRYSSHGSHGGPPEFHMHIPDYSLNDLPIPSVPFRPAYEKMNSRWNIQLAGSALLLIATIAYGLKIDIFWSQLTPSMKNPPLPILMEVGSPVPADFDIYSKEEKIIEVVPESAAEN